MPGQRLAEQELGPLPPDGTRRAYALRILHLFRAAALYPSLAPELTADMRRVSNATKLGLDPSIKHCICKGCGAFLLPGDTASLSADSGTLIYTCRACGARRKILRLDRRRGRRPECPRQAPPDRRRPAEENATLEAQGGSPGAGDAADR